MKMKKIAGLFFVIFWALYLSGCSMFPAGPQPSDVNHWQVGTSAGRLGRLTENQLAQLKQAGFDCIEIGLDVATLIFPSAIRPTAKKPWKKSVV